MVEESAVDGEFIGEIGLVEGCVLYSCSRSCLERCIV